MQERKFAKSYPIHRKNHYLLLLLLYLQERKRLVPVKVLILRLHITHTVYSGYSWSQYKNKMSLLHSSRVALNSLTELASTITLGRAFQSSIILHE